MSMRRDDERGLSTSVQAALLFPFALGLFLALLQWGLVAWAESSALAAAQQTAVAAQALHAGTIQQQLITGEAGTDQQEPEQKKSWFSKTFGGR